MASSTGSAGELSETDPLRGAADTMRAVRQGCVWSQQITHADLVPYLVEESAELIDAVEVGTRADLREELGDLLWQVLFHAAIAAEDPDDPFDIDDVAATLSEKMIRRHPHVFADAVAATPEEVLIHWNAAKAAEKHERRSVLDGISPHMPPLSLAQKLLGRASALVTPPSASAPTPSARHPLRTETPAAERSLGAAVVSRGSGGWSGVQSEEELGEVLLEAVGAARERGWDAERALRGAIRRLEGEIRAAEVG
ncbi:MazG nucleotide pyrophosphohydrolase domain-containing protein [uncultured Microbacterium sp.]|uniref:MazG nucleotide pyrophosphohydrolase domain-containing protein n=1 Tax=uncultured Microbacterium sp. TaxID=191216 RepID=UPI002637821A|nr:MazG nucleotide pyrophosphohydrolase domain-containing protein [uncultured Microbacterium sp.]